LAAGATLSFTLSARSRATAASRGPKEEGKAGAQPCASPRGRARAGVAVVERRAIGVARARPDASLAFRAHVRTAIDAGNTCEARSESVAHATRRSRAEAATSPQAVPDTCICIHRDCRRFRRRGTWPWRSRCMNRAGQGRSSRRRRTPSGRRIPSGCRGTLGTGHRSDRSNTRHRRGIRRRTRRRWLRLRRAPLCVLRIGCSSCSRALRTCRSLPR